MMLDSTSVKGRILDAAARAFATHGVDQTSIDDIARDLGATKGKFTITSDQKANWSVPFASNPYGSP